MDIPVIGWAMNLAKHVFLKRDDLKSTMEVRCYVVTMNIRWLDWLVGGWIDWWLDWLIGTRWLTSHYRTTTIVVVIIMLLENIMIPLSYYYHCYYYHHVTWVLLLILYIMTSLPYYCIVVLFHLPLSLHVLYVGDGDVCEAIVGWEFDGLICRRHPQSRR